MKCVYCANCGMRLNISRKAVKELGRIIDIVEYHECPDEPVELDLTPIDIPTFDITAGKDKFVKKINDLAPKSILGSLSSDALRDRRFEQKEEPKSTAPGSVLDNIKSMMNTSPAHDPINPEPEGSEE